MPRSVLLLEGRGDSHCDLVREFEREGFSVDVSRCPKDALRRFAAKSHDVVVTGPVSWQKATLDFLRHVHVEAHTPVFMLPDGELAGSVVERVLSGLPQDSTEPHDGEICDRLMGRSRAIGAVLDRLAALAPLRVPVLVKGEPGTGRLDAIQRLRQLAGMQEDPFLHVQCHSDRRLRNVRDRCLIYLDEISRLSREDQRGCLTWLRGCEESPELVPLRICASTSVDLGELAASGQFLPDLVDCFERLSVSILPLRERDEDLLDLVPAWLGKLGDRLGRGQISISESAIDRLRSHPWMGNTTELIRILEQLVAFGRGQSISESQVRELLLDSSRGVESSRRRREREQRKELTTLLDKCGGNLAAVARELGMSRGAVIYRAQKYGLH